MTARLAFVAVIHLAAVRGAASAEPAVVTNSIGMQLVAVPSGEFVMGSNESSAALKQAFDVKYEPDVKDEGPPHRVRITKAFYLGKYEVTVGEFRDFVRATGYKTDAERDGAGGVGWYEGKFQRRPEYNWSNWWQEQTDRHPVVNVSWTDSVAFCEWLGKKEGVKYRLPTEGEWEYACRAGTTTRFASGDDATGLERIANFADPRRHPPGTVLTKPVGSYPANAFGLCDMHGNIWEFVADFYQADYYATSPTDDPPGPAKGGSHGLRGSCWGFSPESGRSANRGRANPSTRGYRDGFRVVREM